MGAVDEASGREAPGARCVGGGGAGDGVAVDREVNDSVGGASAGQGRVGRDPVGRRRSGIVGQTIGDSGRSRVESESERRAAGIAGGVGFAGDDDMGAVAEGGRCEGPGARRVGGGGRGDGAAVDREVNDGVGVAVAGQGGVRT